MGKFNLGKDKPNRVITTKKTRVSSVLKPLSSLFPEIADGSHTIQKAQTVNGKQVIILLDTNNAIVSVKFISKITQAEQEAFNKIDKQKDN